MHFVRPLLHQHFATLNAALLLVLIPIGLGCSNGDGPVLDAQVPMDAAAAADGGTEPEPVPSPLVLGLVINHEAEPRIVRGWPLIVRVTATLDDEPDRSYPIPDASLELRFLSPDGTAQAWSLQKIDADDASRALGANVASAEVRLWAGANHTATFPLGPYRGELHWGEGTRELELYVVDPPPLVGPDARRARIAKAALELESLLASGDAAAAFALAEAALLADPDSITLLNWRATALAANGRLLEALTTTSTAIAQFQSQFPAADEPPVTTLGVQAAILRQLEEGAR